MDSLNNYISQYRALLSKGHIQKAYKAIMTFMSGLGAYMGKKYPAYTVSALYLYNIVCTISCQYIHMWVIPQHIAKCLYEAYYSRKSIFLTYCISV